MKLAIELPDCCSVIGAEGVDADAVVVVAVAVVAVVAAVDDDDGEDVEYLRPLWDLWLQLSAVIYYSLHFPASYDISLHPQLFHVAS